MRTEVRSFIFLNCIIKFSGKGLSLVARVRIEFRLSLGFGLKNEWKSVKVPCCEFLKVGFLPNFPKLINKVFRFWFRIIPFLLRDIANSTFAHFAPPPHCQLCLHFNPRVFPRRLTSSPPLLLAYRRASQVRWSDSWSDSLIRASLHGCSDRRRRREEP